MTTSFSNYRLVLIAGAVLSLAACAAPATRPDDALSQAKALVKQAQNAGTRDYAAVDLNHAETELQSANDAMSQSSYKQARFLSQRAQVDAGLALAKTRAAKAEKADKELQKSIQALRQQLSHANTP